MWKKYLIFAGLALSASGVFAGATVATVFFVAPCLLPGSELNANCYCRGGLVNATGEKSVHLAAGGKAKCVKLSKIEYPDTNLNGVDIEGSDIIGSDFSNSKLVSANLRRVNMTGTDFTGADLRVIDASIADFTNADFTDANLSGARLVGATLVDARFYEARLIETDFTGSNMRNADLERAVAKYADFSNADLSGVELAHANFQFANFSYADLREVNLADADFYGAQISGANFDDAFDYDADTLLRSWAWSDRLPRGLPDHANVTVCEASYRGRYEETKQRGFPKYGCATAVVFRDDNTIAERRGPTTIELNTYGRPLNISQGMSRKFRRGRVIGGIKKQRRHGKKQRRHSKRRQNMDTVGRADSRRLKRQLFNVQ